MDLERRVAALEERVQRLDQWHQRCENRDALDGLIHRVAARIHQLGPSKVDLHLIARLNTALDTDLLPVAGRKQAPKPAGKTKKKP